MKKYLPHILVLCLFLFGFSTYIDLAANYHWTGAHIFDSIQLGNSANNGSIELPLAGNTTGQEGNWRLMIDVDGKLLRQYCLGDSQWSTIGTDEVPGVYAMTIADGLGIADSITGIPPSYDMTTQDTLGMADAVTITNLGDEIALYTGTITGTDVIDAVGSYNLAIGGGVTQVSGGKVGDGLAFNGSTGYATHATLWDTAPAAMSLSFWIYRSAVNVTNSVISKDNDLTTNSVDSIHIYFAAADNKLHSTKTNNAAAGIILDSTTDFAINTYYHVVITCGAAGYKLYVNNSQEDSDASTTFMGSGTTTNFTLGAYNTGVQFFNGRIDQFRIFDKQLSTAEISYWYNSGNGR